MASLGLICKGFLLVIFLGIAAVLLRTFTLHQRAIEALPCSPLDTDFIQGDSKLVGRFQQAIRFRTIARDVGDYEREELHKLQKYIIKSYPTIHSSPLVQWETVANYSLLYTVVGSDPGLKPFMLTGHMDVVPVNREKWEAEPFGGDIINGFIYGRGTIDDKHTVFGILEAFEFLMKRGHKPTRGFYVAFGHDEEVSGGDGARAIAEVLLSRNAQVEFLVDEGMTILNNAVPGLDRPCALIGSSEKGWLSVNISVETEGGHSSMPRHESSIGILAQAVTRLEANRHPSMFGTGPEIGMFEHLAPEMKPAFRVLMTNLWLFSPLVSWFLSRKPETNALIRTTTAVTKFNGGFKDNVIAPYASALVNHRIHPTQTVAEVVEYDKKIINDDRVKVTIKDFTNPLPQSPYGDQFFGWQTIKTSIRQVWGHKNVVVAPSVMIGNTDTKYYTGLTDSLYRFSPTYMFPDDLKRFHGDNERISVKNYEEAVNFYYHLMMNANEEKLKPMHSHGGEL